jgi:hypothetical protein
LILNIDEFGTNDRKEREQRNAGDGSGIVIRLASKPVSRCNQGGGKIATADDPEQGGGVRTRPFGSAGDR